MIIMRFAILVLLLISLSSASEVWFYNDTYTWKNTTNDSMVLYLSQQGPAYIYPNYTLSYYWLKIENNNLVSQNWTGENDVDPDPNLSITTTKIYNVENITQEVEQVLDWNETNVSLYWRDVPYTRLVYNNLSLLDIVVGSNNNFLVEVRTPVGETGHFDVCFTINGYIYCIDPDISGCGTISSSGIYTVTTPLITLGTCLTVNANDVFIDLNGFGMSGDGIGATDYGVTATSRKNITVTNGPISTFARAISFTLVNDSLVDRVATTSNTNAIFLASTRNVVVRDNDISSFTTNGILTSGDTGPVISDNLIDGTGTSGIGISPNNMASGLIENNTIHDTGSWGVFSFGGGAGNRYNNNSIDHANASGLYLEVVDSSNFTNNLITNSLQSGIYLLRCTNCIIDLNQVYNTSQTACYVQYNIGTDNIYRNNYAFNCTTAGYQVITNSHRNTFINNTANYTPAGFYNSNSNNNSFINNTVINATDIGMLVSTSSNTIVLGNNISRSVRGVLGQAAVNLTVENNTIFNMTDYGIRMNTVSENNTIKGNIVSLAASQAILISSSVNNSIQSNHVSSSATGIYIDTSSITNLISNHYWNNTAALQIAGSTSFVNATNEIFDSISGSYSSFANLSFYDNLTSSVQYKINWSSNTSALAYNQTSLANKYFNISIVSGTLSIENATVYWTDAEVNEIQERFLALWLYNGTWTKLGASLSQPDNSLTLISLTQTGIYAILLDGGDSSNLLISGALLAGAGYLLYVKQRRGGRLWCFLWV